MEERHSLLDSSMIAGRHLSLCCINLVSRLDMLALDATPLKQRGRCLEFRSLCQLFLKTIVSSFHLLESKIVLTVDQLPDSGLPVNSQP